MLQNSLNSLSGSPSDLEFELEAQVGIDHILSVTVSTAGGQMSRLRKAWP